MSTYENSFSYKYTTARAITDFLVMFRYTVKLIVNPLLTSFVNCLLETDSIFSLRTVLFLSEF